MARKTLQDERHELAEKCRTIQDQRTVDITLDGKPATICGFLNDFGTVYSMDNMRGAEWSWHAIHGILTKHAGKFRMLDGKDMLDG